MKASTLFCILAAGAFLAAPRPASADPLDGILVVVNDSAITGLQVDDAIRQELLALADRYRNDPQTFYAKKHALETNEVEDLIQRKLILDDFNKGGYSTNVLESAVDEEINQAIKDHYGGNRSTLIKTLSAEGKTYEEFRREQRDLFIIRYMSAHNAGIRKVLISPLKIQNYYNTNQARFKAEDQVKLRMIQVTQPPDSPPGAVRQIAAEILQKIDSGVPFDEMASVYSSHTSRPLGGDTGWVARKDLATAISDVAFSLKAGEHSQVIEVPDERTGDTICYLLRVDETRPAHLKTLSEVAPEIEQTLKDEEQKRLVDQWIKRLEAKSHIEYFSLPSS
ncbi:MAG: peptidylprolyl isomerase [Verrucomicrobiota bacterium]|jgi:peptidyl-prolyl cis-trans isomerase SurA